MFKYKIIHREELERIKREKDEIISNLETQVSLLKETVQKYRSFELQTGIKEKVFKSGDERVGYMARVAGFFEDVLKDKLLTMIEKLHVLIEEDANTERQDMAIKGAIYAFRELYLWGDECTREYQGFIVSQPKPKEGSKTPEEELASLLV